jgi:hypothetical protein
MKWKESLIEELIKEIKSDKNWNLIVSEIEHRNIGIHLAIFNEPFLSLIFNGQKEIESRFSIKKISPYRRICSGDLVILKKSGGSVMGAFIAGEVKCFNKLHDDHWEYIENEYGNLICTHHDPEFWNKREMTRYATLIRIKNIMKVTPFKINKKDRSGWSVIHQSEPKDLFK